jgi:hypothetical protein
MVIFVERDCEDKVEGTPLRYADAHNGAYQPGSLSASRGEASTPSLIAIDAGQVLFARSAHSG